jgi:N-acyl-phosphatidylethanolamine-hydrolysing phospholipase D
MRPVGKLAEIGSKYGPFDIAMIPIWRGGSLSLIARLGFRVRFFSFLPLPQN